MCTKKLLLLLFNICLSLFFSFYLFCVFCVAKMFLIKNWVCLDSLIYYTTTVVTRIKDVLLNRIEHEYICCDTNLVTNLSQVSSNINEVIKEVITSLFIFLWRDFTHKSTHKQKNKNMKKKHISKHVLKKRLRRKSFIHLLAFCAV